MSNLNEQPCSKHDSESTRLTRQTPTMEREYEFFVTTEEPQQPEGSDRGLIRRLVMKNFFDSKSAGPSSNTSEHNSASTVQAKTKLKSRFRLSKSGQPEAENKTKTRHKHTTRNESGEEKVNRESRERSSISGIRKPDIYQLKDQGRTGHRGQSSNEATGTVTGRPPTGPELLKTNPNTHRFDPFDVLPVPGTPQMDILFKLCKKPFS